MSKAPRVGLQEAWDDVAGLSKPGKMPSYGHSISALRCNIGSKLRQVPGSTCADCYALKNRYTFSSVQAALELRYQRLDSPTWVESMAQLINALVPDSFRWFDSGDLQSMEHLIRIVRVVKLTPNIQHWLPTREYALVKAYRGQYGAFPSNLTVRLSAQMVDAPPPSAYGLPTSTVITHNNGAATFICEAKTRGNKCGPCRACWDPTVADVAYPIH